MLSDAQIERYSRQIVLPEVGGRGQARLLAARVLLAGAGEAATTAAALIGRAGVGALDLIDAGPLPEPSPDCRLTHREAGSAELAAGADVVVDLGDDVTRRAALGGDAQRAGRPFVTGRQAGAAAVLALVVGRPCIGCMPPAVLELGTTPGPSPLAPPAAVVLGALAASEVLQAILAPPTAGRVHVVDLAAGIFRATPLAATAGCPRCRGTA